MKFLCFNLSIEFHLNQLLVKSFVSSLVSLVRTTGHFLSDFIKDYMILCQFSLLAKFQITFLILHLFIVLCFCCTSGWRSTLPRELSKETWLLFGWFSASDDSPEKKMIRLKRKWFSWKENGISWKENEEQVTGLHKFVSMVFSTPKDVYYNSTATIIYLPPGSYIREIMWHFQFSSQLKVK